MSQFKTFITRDIGQEAINKIEQISEIIVWPEATPPSKEELISQISDVDALVCMLTDPISKELIQSAPKLKVISQMAVGVDNIDVKYATSIKLPVGHTPDVLSNTTADFAWALLMAAARRVVNSHIKVHQGNWDPWGPYVWAGYDIHGSTLGIIGLGRIGQAMAKRASGFDMKVVYYSKTRKPDFENEFGVQFVSLDQLYEQADFISLHTYLSPETKHLINRESFTKMKPNAILINTARGAVVDQQALFDALQTNQIAGAAIDVSDPEPIPENDPLLTLPNVIITPHIASSSYKTREKMAIMMAENVLAGLSNKKIPFCANPEVYNKQKYHPREFPRMVK